MRVSPGAIGLICSPGIDVPGYYRPSLQDDFPDTPQRGQESSCQLSRFLLRYDFFFVWCEKNLA